jgi:hypothetical protein
MNVIKKATPSRRARTRILAVAGVTACAVSAGIVTAAPASAASRGFTVTNSSNATLSLEGLNRVHHVLCVGGRCVPGVPYPMEFEGRPQVGSDIAPGGSQRFELKYGFDLIGGIQYAAQLTYKIEKTNAKLEVWIDTTPLSNNSRCEVVPASAGRCTAGGTQITFTPVT